MTHQIYMQTFTQPTFNTHTRLSSVVSSNSSLPNWLNSRPRIYSSITHLILHLMFIISKIFYVYIYISSFYLTSSNANIHTLISLFQISSAGKACMRDRNNLGPHLHAPIRYVYRTRHVRGWIFPCRHP